MLEEMGNIIKTAATDGTQASQSRLTCIQHKQRFSSTNNFLENS
jgi:hypothetical protein